MNLNGQALLSDANPGPVTTSYRHAYHHSDMRPNRPPTANVRSQREHIRHTLLSLCYFSLHLGQTSFSTVTLSARSTTKRRPRGAFCSRQASAWSCLFLP